MAFYISTMNSKIYVHLVRASIRISPRPCFMMHSAASDVTRKQASCPLSAVSSWKRTPVRSFCRIQAAVPVRGRGAGCRWRCSTQEDVAHFVLSRGMIGPKTQVGTSLCLYLFGACPNRWCLLVLVCFFF